MSALIDEYVKRVQELSRDEFIEAHPQPFLLLYIEDDGEGSEAWTFKTKTIRAISSAGLATMMEEEAARYRVFSLIKAHTNPWRERISVGRARNNDVVLSEPSVSKLHAHFWVDKSGQMHLSDSGSRNGTQVGDRTLKPGSELMVQVGDTITFGAVTVTLLDAAGLYDVITRQLNP